MSSNKNKIPSKRPNLALLDLKIKKADEKIKKLEVAFKHKYQALENFLTLLVNFASHDIKNSIHSIDGMVSTIDVNGLTTLDIDNIKICLDHVRTTLDKFSDLNVQEKKVNSFELSKLLSSLEILHRPYMYQDKIKFSVKYDSDELKRTIVAQDFHSILYMFNNLMINSITALNGIVNGEISIFVSSTSISNVDYLCFNFSDNGVGVKKEHRDKIFSPYFTTKPDGTGVGLTHVKFVLDSIVNGSVKLLDNNENNSQTTFEIIIPLKNDNEQQDSDN